MTKKAFTLVELIVVITILAVLATVAFISFQGYGQSARDSTRLSDMKSMEKILDLSKLTNNRYPTPVNSVSVTYSGSVAWTQGVFGQTAYTTNASMSNVPTDPVTALEYPYSITSNGQEYQLAAVLENPVTSTITQTTYAGTQEAQVYVKGNYNGTFLKVRKDNTTYLLGVPSILTSDIVSSQLLEDIITNKSLVYNGHKNLPASFSGSIYKTDGGFDFGGAPYVASDIILFEGDIGDLETNQADRVTFFTNLQASYSGSVIASEEAIVELINISPSSASAASNYVASALNNSLKTSIAIQEVVAQATVSCVSNPNPESDFIFDSGTNTITGNNGVTGEIVIPCTIGGVDVLHIGSNAFNGSSLTGAVIPSSVLTIGTSAFNGNLITDLTIGESVTSIGTNAFNGNQLTSLTIPNSVTTIGTSAFYENQLITLTLPNNITSIGSSSFRGNDLISLTIPNSVTSIGNSTFMFNQLTSLTIGSGMTSIGTSAFRGNDLISLTIPNSVTSIGNSSFRDNKLTSLTLGDGVTSIGEDSFWFNDLPSLTIPGNVTSIGDRAFYYNLIETIVVNCSLPTFGVQVFYNNGAGRFTSTPNPVSCI